MDSDRQAMSDHDLLIRIDERTERMEDRVTNHSGRLRQLEQNQSRAVGIVVAVGSIITVLTNLAIQLWDKIRLK